MVVVVKLFFVFIFSYVYVCIRVGMCRLCVVPQRQTAYDGDNKLSLNHMNTFDQG